jgi:hypothetical protein
LLNDERSTGGHSRLARLFDGNYSTLWRKYSRKGQITQTDELAIEQEPGRTPLAWIPTEGKPANKLHGKSKIR